MSVRARTKGQSVWEWAGLGWAAVLPGVHKSQNEYRPAGPIGK